MGIKNGNQKSDSSIGFINRIHKSDPAEESGLGSGGAGFSLSGSAAAGEQGMGEAFEIHTFVLVGEERSSEGEGDCYDQAW